MLKFRPRYPPESAPRLQSPRFADAPCRPGQTFGEGEGFKAGGGDVAWVVADASPIQVASKFKSWSISASSVLMLSRKVRGKCCS